MRSTPDRRPGRRARRQPQAPDRSGARVRDRPLSSASDAAGQPVTGFHQPLRVGRLWRRPGAAGTMGCADARSVDFFDVKGDLEALFAPRALGFRQGRPSGPASRPFRPRHCSTAGKSASSANCIPHWVQKYELGRAPVVFELELGCLAGHADCRPMREVSRFPAVTRDLALVVAREQALAPLLDCLARRPRPAIVQRHPTCSTCIRAKGLPEGRKSLAFRVVMQDTATNFGGCRSRCGDGQAWLTVASTDFGADLARLRRIQGDSDDTDQGRTGRSACSTKSA